MLILYLRSNIIHHVKNPLKLYNRSCLKNNLRNPLPRKGFQLPKCWCGRNGKDCRSSYVLRDIT